MFEASRLRRISAIGARFLTVGALSTLIEIGVFNLLILVFDWDPVAAKIVASLVALVNAYFGNREWTYRNQPGRRDRRSEIAWFLVVNALCLGLGALIVWAGEAAAQEILGRTIGPFIINGINIVSIGIVVVVRFVLYHWVVFRAPKPTTAPESTPTE